MKTYRRRDVLRCLGLGGLGLLATGTSPARAFPNDVPLVLSLQLGGGLDARASFDALSAAGGQTQGRFPASDAHEAHGHYVSPPLAPFVDAYGADLRVLTGIDCLRQPPHSRLHVNTGRYEAGYPHICALHAASVAPDAAIPFLDYAPKSGAATAGLCAVVRRIPLEGFANLANPAFATGSSDPLVSQDLRSVITNARREGYQRSAQTAGLASRASRAEQLEAAMSRIDGLSDIAGDLPTSNGFNSMSDAEVDARIVLGAMASGRIPAAQIEMLSFDTHGVSALGSGVVQDLADLLTVIVEEAQRLGIWDRLVVLGVTEFTRIGRPNRVAEGGTNHHDTTTCFVLKKGINSDGRGLIGRTDDDAKSTGLEPDSLVSGGPIIPTYVDYMAMIRDLLDIPDELDSMFPLNVGLEGTPGLANAFRMA